MVDHGPAFFRTNWPWSVFPYHGWPCPAFLLTMVWRSTMVDHGLTTVDRGVTIITYHEACDHGLTVVWPWKLSKYFACCWPWFRGRPWSTMVDRGHISQNSLNRKLVYPIIPITGNQIWSQLPYWKTSYSRREQFCWSIQWFCWSIQWFLGTTVVFKEQFNI